MIQAASQHTSSMRIGSDLHALPGNLPPIRTCSAILQLRPPKSQQRDPSSHLTRANHRLNTVPQTSIQLTMSFCCAWPHDRSDGEFEATEPPSSQDSSMLWCTASAISRPATSSSAAELPLPVLPDRRFNPQPELVLLPPLLTFPLAGRRNP